MNDQTLGLPANSDAMPPRGPLPLAQEDEINLRELLDIVWSGKWIVALVTLAFLVLSVLYALVATPIYQASGLVQVEKEQGGLTASLDELSSLIGSGPVESPAEIAIIKSRMVLGVVAASMKLHIDARPKYFPVIGKAIVRRRSELTAPAPAPFGLDHYAWGGEVLRVTTLELPEAWHNTTFTLEAKPDGFDLKNQDGSLVLSGKAGERAGLTSAEGPVAIFVQELQARPGTQFLVTRRADQTLFADLSDGLSVTEEPRDSGVLSLRYEADDPRFAADLINEVEEAYLRQNVERRSAQAEQSLEFLKRQLPELREAVDAAQARLNTYQLQKGTVDVQRETDLILTQAVALETERLRLVQERDATLQRFTDQHPVVITLAEQIRGIEREQANLKKQVESLPETQQEILSLMRDLEVNTQLYTALLNSAQELQVTKAGTVGNVRIIDRSLVPLAPIKPNKKLIVALGLLLGGFCGVLIVFAMRALLRGVDRPEDVERALGLPTYASIPFSSAQKRIMSRVSRDSRGHTVLAAVDSEDLAVEALRSLRTSLHFAMLEASNNIVVFTGPVAALGKSFVTINLGAVLAMSGKRVIVVDADMRRGRLYRYAGVPQKPGLSDYIASSATQDTVIHKTALAGLDFISSGTRPPNPSEILMSERFGELLKTLSKQYDYVLIDTPPALPVTDAAIVGRLAGTTLLVLKSAEHPMRAIEETVKRLRNAGVPVRGMIFNQVGARVGSYGYGAYGYAYGYSSYGYHAKTKSD